MGRSAKLGILVGFWVLGGASQGCEQSISASEGEVILGFDGDASLEEFLEAPEEDPDADERDAATGDDASTTGPSTEGRAQRPRGEGLDARSAARAHPRRSR